MLLRPAESTAMSGQARTLAKADASRPTAPDPKVLLVAEE